MPKFFFISCLILLSGCSTAGPFVTGISSNGKGGLVVEKSNVEYNWLLGVVSNKDTTSSTIQIFPENEK